MKHQKAGTDIRKKMASSGGLGTDLAASADEESQKLMEVMNASGAGGGGGADSATMDALAKSLMATNQAVQNLAGKVGGAGGGENIPTPPAPIVLGTSSQDLAKKSVIGM